MVARKLIHQMEHESSLSHVVEEGLLEKLNFLSAYYTI